MWEDWDEFLQFWHFLKKIIKIPTPGQKIIVESIKIPHPRASESGHIPFSPYCTQEEAINNVSIKALIKQ